MKTRTFHTLLAVLVLALFAASCTEPTLDTDADADAAAETDPATPPSSELRDELRIATTSFGNESLDPIMALTDNGRFLRLMFDPLVGSDYAAEEISKETGVAEDWTVSSDGTVYTFTIREGITFHNGDELTAEDVKFTLDRYHSPEASTPNTSAISALIDSVSVLSPTEVEVTLTRPSIQFLTLISNIVDPGALIVPKDHFEEVGAEAFGQHPIGSGPYEFVERATGSHITVERAFDQHFAIGEPRFERVTLRLVSEEPSRVAMLRAGDVDFADIGIDSVAVVEEDGFDVFRHNGLAPLYAVFQLREGEPTDDINLRSALSHAIDREELNETLLDGQGEPTGNIWPGVGEPIPPTPYDPETAEELLAQTPYGSDGDPVNLVMQVSPSAGWPQMLLLAQGVQDYWQRIGIESSLVYRDFGAVRTEWVSGDLQPPAVVFMNFDPQVDWHSVVATVWTCEGLFDNVCDPELDAIHAEWGAASTMEEYIELANAHEQMMHDNFYVIPIVAAQLHYAGNDQIPEGYRPGDAVRGFNVRALVWTP